MPRWAGGTDEASNLHVLCPHCHVASEGLIGLEYWRWFRNTLFIPDLEAVEAYRRYLQRQFDQTLTPSAASDTSLPSWPTSPES